MGIASTPSIKLNCLHCDQPLSVDPYWRLHSSFFTTMSCSSKRVRFVLPPSKKVPKTWDHSSRRRVVGSKIVVPDKVFRDEMRIKLKKDLDVLIQISEKQPLVVPQKPPAKSKWHVALDAFAAVTLLTLSLVGLVAFYERNRWF